MRFLFVHQNLPGQFKHLIPALANDPAHEVVAIGDHTNIKDRPELHPRVTRHGYLWRAAQDGGVIHHYLRSYDAAVRRGQAVAQLALDLRAKGFVPDVVVGHPGWGETLFLRDVFPAARHLYYFEFYYRSQGSDVNFDPEFPSDLDEILRLRIRNSLHLVSLQAATAGWSPTIWQKSQLPIEFQAKISVQHEGIDTALLAPNPAARIELNGQVFSAGEEIITYVSRNLEPYRGFHIFMRALPEILAARPNARVIVLGGDEVSYGRALPAGHNYREKYLAELGTSADWSRVHFIGKLPYAGYLKVLQVSKAHVYLTYPFVLSWSMLEAMSAGAPLVASATAPVMEVVHHEHNGLLFDFFDTHALTRAVCRMLDDDELRNNITKTARDTIMQRYDLESVCLPDLMALVQRR